MFLFVLHGLPAIIGLAVTIVVPLLLILWLGVMLNKERKGIARKFKNPGCSNRKQRRTDQAMKRQRKKLR